MKKFTLKKKDTVYKTLAIGDLEVQLQYDGDSGVNTAVVQIQEAMVRKQGLTKAALRGDEMNPIMAMLWLIGERLVQSWNAEDEKLSLIHI